MTTIKVNAIEPEGGTTNLTIGMTGQNVVVGGSGGIKANTFKDAGGNTLWTSNGSGVLSSVSGFGGAQVLISSQTASNSASLSFTSGIDSTYKEYIWECINIAPATDTANFNFQVNASGQTGYNEVMTTTSFRISHVEDNSNTPAVTYNAGKDQAQGTAYQTLAGYIGNDSDQCCDGELHLFNPSSTTYVKHWSAEFNAYDATDYFLNHYIGGYINTTAAITQIDFKFSSGNIASGTIKMYGVK